MKYFIFSHRIRVLVPFLVMTFGFLALLLRMIDLQIVQGATLRQVSEDNRFFQKDITADRGIFFDRFDTPLVFNKPIYYKVDNPTQLFSPETQLRREEAIALVTASPAAVVRRTFRSYPYKTALSSLLGYVGAVTKEELVGSQLEPQDEVGKTGIERSLDLSIRGRNGQEVYELNAQGEILRKVSKHPAEAGQNVSLTIDAELSQYVTEQMNGITGAVIVGDPESGEILAMISSPSFDANILTQPTFDPEETKAKSQQLTSYFSDSQKVFFNRAISGVYPPGSIFKPITALAGLEQEAFTARTTVDDQGTLKVADAEFGNWYYRQYGRVEGELNVRRALARSNDIFFYKAAEWLGPDKLAESARIFGLGKKTGIELAGEASGLVPDPAWKEKTIGERWYLGNTYHFGIGQGDLLVTPIQMFSATSVFANHGKRCTPHVIQRFEGDAKKRSVECQELGYNEEHLQEVVQGMVAACSAGGTAFPFFVRNANSEHPVACKTGTAEFGSANEDGHRKTHGWFTAIAEVTRNKLQVTNVEDNAKDEQLYPKKVVITILVESDEIQPFREGSTDAAPIALEILEWIEENR